MKKDVEGISLTWIQLVNWIMLLFMTTGAWLVFSGLMAGSVLVGGIIANVSFWRLQKDLTRLLQGSLIAVKARFFVKYYARLFLLLVILFLLIKNQLVQSMGLLVGLSTVLFSIILAVVVEAKKIYPNIKEAS